METAAPIEEEEAQDRNPELHPTAPHSIVEQWGKMKCKQCKKGCNLKSKARTKRIFEKR